MKGKTKIIFLWIIFIVIDILIAVGISEVWIRLFIPAKNICYVSDPKIGPRFCPNQKTYGYVEKGYSNVLMTNGLGFHDYERAAEKLNNTYRIQIYGDSMIQGYCVPRESTIPILMERYLNSQGLPVKFEVFNMAPGDDGTSAQIMTYKEIGRSFKPDLVIGYFMDDFPDNVMQIHGRTYSPYYKIDQNGELVYIPPIPKDTSTLWERFKQTSSFYRLLANKFLESKFYFQVVRFEKNLISYVRGIGSSNPDGLGKDYETTRKEICIKEGWPLTLRLIKHFKEEVEESGSQFVLVDGEEFYDVNVGSVYANRDLAEYCLKNGISYIPGYERYAQLKSVVNPQKYFFKDHHLTALGNEEVARFVGQKIKEHLLADGMAKIQQKKKAL